MKHRVKEAREAKGLSQLALSELVGVSLTSVQNWESGRGAPSSGRLKKLSQALGRPIRWFVDDEVDATFDNIAQAEVKAEASTEQRLLSMLEKQQALMTEQLALAERQRSDIANLTEAIKVQQQAFLAEREFQQRLAGRQLDTIEELRAEVAELRSQVRKDRGGRNPGVPATAAPGAAG